MTAGMRAVLDALPALTDVRREHHAAPKGTTRQQAKGRKDRTAAKVVKSVRAQCVERDGECRFGDWENNPGDWHSDALEGDACEGPSQWCHMHQKRRSKTQGQAPEIRHTTADSFMGCQRHHDAYDGRRTPRLRIMCLTRLGANGALKFTRAKA